jgi:moderate conductance mechanosensitive channel
MWYQRISNNSGDFFITLALYALVAVGFLLIALFLLSRWLNYARRTIDERDIWNDESKANEHERLKLLTFYLRRSFGVTALLLWFGLVALEYQVPVIYNFASAVRTWLNMGGVGKLLRIALVGVTAFVVIALIRRSAKILTPTKGQRFERDVARAATIRGIVESSARVLFVVLFVLYALNELGAPVGTFLAGLGILGLAVSFGAQSLVKDFLNGFFILAEGQYGVGDVVRIGELSGDVEAITLRTTSLRDLDGRVHIIPNGQINMVSVMSKDWSRAVAEIEVAYETNLDKALEVFQDEAMKLYNDEDFSWKMLEPPHVLGVQSFNASGVTLRLLFKTLPKEQWGVSREFRKRLKTRFESEGIEIPYPHMKVLVEKNVDLEDLGVEKSSAEKLSVEKLSAEDLGAQHKQQ